MPAAMDSTVQPRTDSPSDATSVAVSEPSSVSRFNGRRVHFIGIGGCGMSGLARMLLDCGAIVSGSEPKPNPQSFALSERGVKICAIKRENCFHAKSIWL